MDSNDLYFKDLWKKQSASKPNIEDLLARVRQFKKVSLRRLWITNILLAATCISIIFIWYYCQPEFLSTKIGIVVTISTMVIYLVVYNRLMTIYKNIDITLDNQEYLKQLILIKKKEQFMQSTMLSLYFISLGTGIASYMYEYVVRMSIFWRSFTYGVTFLWMMFNWFFLRPKHIKKEQAKINALIEKFEEVNKH